VQLFELCAFVLLILPSMVLGIFETPAGTTLGFAVIAAATMARDVSLVVLVAYFLWRNGEGAWQLGWVGRGAWKEIAIGVVLFFPMTLVADALEGLLRDTGLSGPRVTSGFLHAQGTPDVALAVGLVLVVAIAEETLFRGYLILRLRALTGSATAAVIGSSMLFALGHGYEGARGMVTVGVMGLAFALVYLWRKSLVAPVVMHFLQDLFAIVILPALVHHGG
jgi:membrane protease YdiL (CAAX protease family)